MYYNENSCLIIPCGHFFVNNLETTHVSLQATESENGEMKQIPHPAEAL